METVEPSSAVVPHHKHPDGYFFLRLPCPDPNKVLFHRQLWQDLNGRRLSPKEMVHHRNGLKGGQCVHQFGDDDQGSPVRSPSWDYIQKW